MKQEEKLMVKEAPPDTSTFYDKDLDLKESKDEQGVAPFMFTSSILKEESLNE